MFQERLNQLLKDNHLFQTDLAKYVGYTTQAVSKWCRGENEPDLSSLIKIAKFFGVTTDYLLGMDCNNINDKDFEEIEKIALRKVFVNAGYIKNTEYLSDDELRKIAEFVKTNKKYIKDAK